VLIAMRYYADALRNALELGRLAQVVECLTAAG
jgi:hypothetical protein